MALPRKIIPKPTATKGRILEKMPMF